MQSSKNSTDLILKTCPNLNCPCSAPGCDGHYPQLLKTFAGKEIEECSGFKNEENVPISSSRCEQNCQSVPRHTRISSTRTYPYGNYHSEQCTPLPFSNSVVKAVISSPESDCKGHCQAISRSPIKNPEEIKYCVEMHPEECRRLPVSGNFGNGSKQLTSCQEKQPAECNTLQICKGTEGAVISSHETDPVKFYGTVPGCVKNKTLRSSPFKEKHCKECRTLHLSKNAEDAEISCHESDPEGHHLTALGYARNEPEEMVSCRGQKSESGMKFHTIDEKYLNSLSGNSSPELNFTSRKPGQLAYEMRKATNAFEKPFSEKEQEGLVHLYVTTTSDPLRRPRMILGYTGHVPGRLASCGETYSEECKTAVVKFMKRKLAWSEYYSSLIKTPAEFPSYFSLWYEIPRLDHHVCGMCVNMKDVNPKSYC